MIFLSEKFVLSTIIPIFAAREPAKPLNDAQMCGSFFFIGKHLRRGNPFAIICRPYVTCRLQSFYRTLILSFGFALG